MLDGACPSGRSPRPFLSQDIAAEVASEHWQREAYFRLRQEIFACEQGLFASSDIDARDDVATPIVALARVLGIASEVVGVVRIYPAGGGVWYGGRLGVASQYRRVGAVGGSLITTAVSTAHAWGCTRFLATVQPQNVRYFERYHFRTVGDVDVCGQPHALMRARLGSYPACPKALLALARSAA
jgi:putative N-acetyltransferase (TIGR04045 family)